MQGKIEKKPYETSDQARNRVIQQKTEDRIINDMLLNHQIIVDPIALKYSKYVDSDNLVQDQYNLIAFSISCTF